MSARANLSTLAAGCALALGLLVGAVAPATAQGLLPLPNQPLLPYPDQTLLPLPGSSDGTIRSGYRVLPGGTRINPNIGSPMPAFATGQSGDRFGRNDGDRFPRPRPPYYSGVYPIVIGYPLGYGYGYGPYQGYQQPTNYFAPTVIVNVPSDGTRPKVDADTSSRTLDRPVTQDPNQPRIVAAGADRGPAAAAKQAEDDDYYLNRKPEPKRDPGLTKAIDDIETAFRAGNVALLARHIAPADNLVVHPAAAGAPNRTISAGDYVGMSRDAFKEMTTLTFKLDKVTELKDGVWKASGTHVFRAATGPERKYDVSFWLKQVDDQWVITDLSAARSKE